MGALTPVLLLDGAEPRRNTWDVLEIFQPRLAAVLCPLLWVTLLGQGVGLGDPQRSLPTPNILGFWVKHRTSRFFIAGWLTPELTDLLSPCCVASCDSVLVSTSPGRYPSCVVPSSE